ncbi:hypothetical protein VB620_11440 [Nodularia harveyana UHCC-0300]|uniref:Uncharacterized protein n=1 Tax=Nodularia harveyana UHCC-0300 TaxID=2974287 RepID=A0ABU5UEJ6_9CYAN|nr:hypothetical protein [Nodularia harveyana]MEA5581952.1 hypothetical protein [Nodularia harveyana UHCC-0300]
MIISVLTSYIILTANLARADRWTDQVRSQLIKAALAAGFGGYSLTHDPFIGDLGNGGENDITLNLRGNVSYAIVGACDSDCRDIDLKVYDDNGNLISSDLQRDDTPLVRFTPRWNARFTIRVIMPNCSNAPCRYGIGAFGKSKTLREL